MMRKILDKDKKGLSEMVSYVLLLVIAIGMASAVYAWVKGYLPSATPKETCNVDASLSVENYACDSATKIINITIRNRGSFNVSGFFIRATNSSLEKTVPTSQIVCNDDLRYNCVYAGRYDFTAQLKPTGETDTHFKYTQLQNITRIQIQPYVMGKKPVKTLLCEKTIDMWITGCN